MKVESRDDAQVEEKRQRLLVACGGFRAHDEHLNSFFNDPIPKAMGEMPSRVYVRCIARRQSKKKT